MKVAFVVQRYGEAISGGAEQHCRLVAEKMAKHVDVEVLTTRAREYMTWKNEFPKGTAWVNDVFVRRFPVSKERDPARFGRIQDRVFYNSHTVKDELLWMDEQGPRCPSLIKHIAKQKDDYDYFIFFSYRYYHSYHGMEAARGKAILVPTAEEDEAIRLGIFKDAFHLPSAIIYNSIEERELIQSIAGNQAILNDVVGTGSDIPDFFSPAKFRKKHGIEGDFILYVGRIDKNKGFPELFHHFIRYLEETKANLKLVLIGQAVVDVPVHPGIVPLGFLPLEDKYNGLAASLLLVMPSYYESLSMILLEAWAAGRPALVNGRCKVLRGQALRGNGGLFYESYGEFREALALLVGDQRLCTLLGENGRKYFERNYTWEIIEKKYLNILGELEKRKSVRAD